MRSVVVLGLLVLSSSSCTDEGKASDCIFGVCAGDPTETRAFPGPCRAAGIGYAQHCTFTYDGAQRLARSACHYYYGVDELDDAEDDAVAQYHYDASGAITSIDQIDDETDKRTWTFGATTIDVVEQPANTLHKQYDRALFAFYPGRLVDRVVLRADLGMTKLGPSTYAWTRDGSALVRSGGAGPNIRYSLDAAGRLLSTDPPTQRFEYEGDRLAGQYENGFEYRYVYDGGGNLIEIIATGLAGPDDVRPLEVFDYSCWGAL
ncbi:MAG: hypothetical protein JNL83_05995 [Myxococcales bacterium]|nr:hypothetical protein [Myxococcales bacterium]